MKTRFLVAIAAILCAFRVPVRAQASLNDLILAFQSSSGTGASVNIEVDLGSALTFTALSPGTTYSIVNLGTDLAATYGGSTTWNNNSSLSFGIVGATDSNGTGGVAPQTIWASSNGNPGTAYTAVSTNLQSSPTGKIQGLYGITGARGSFGDSAHSTDLTDISAQAGTDQAGSSLDAISTSTSNAGSWTSIKASNTFGISGAATKLLSSADVGSGSATTTLYEIQPSDSGASPTVVDMGSFVLSSTGELSYDPSGPPSTHTGGTYSRLANLSIRSVVGAGGQSVTVGFVVAAGTTGATLPVLLRATGPALANFGVTNFLPDPGFSVYSGTTAIASNNGWGANAAAITSVDQMVGAFALTDSTSHDAALTSSFSAGEDYTAIVTSGSSDSGVALAEAYDATPAASVSSSAPRLINVSARAQVGSGANILIAGFVIEGNAPKAVLIRAIGPGLTQFGVTGVLGQPELTLFDSTGASVTSNTGWSGTATLSAAFAKVGAFSIDANSADSAILVTLNPGAYTAQVSGVGGTTGDALMEVYDAD